MIVTVGPNVDPSLVRAALIEHGLWVRRFDGLDAVQFFIEPMSPSVARETILKIEGVVDVAVSSPSTPRLDAHPSTLDVGGVAIGAGAAPVLMAGPCSVETEEQNHSLASEVARAGGSFLRGGAFKPRTSPYDFQGHGQSALRWLRTAADQHHLRVVTEALQPSDAPLVAEYADLVQVGSRNMHNAPLLRAVGATHRPVLLKRGMAATVDEWLFAAETLLLHGAQGVVLCERGIRGFETSTRFTLDIAAVALIAHVHHLPIIVDPSHAAGRRDLIPALCDASIAAGAAGVMVESHDRPGCALSDGPQAISPETLSMIGARMFARTPGGREPHVSNSSLRSCVA